MKNPKLSEDIIHALKDVAYDVKHCIECKDVECEDECDCIVKISITTSCIEHALRVTREEFVKLVEELE